MNQSVDPVSAFNDAAASEPKQAPEQAPETADIASRARMVALEKQLSEPRARVDLTPMGTIVRPPDPARDTRNLDEIERIRARLEQRRNQALDAFAQATEAEPRQRLQQRMKM